MADAQAPNKNWHTYLQKALQAQSTLLNPKTNATPHAKMFTFDRQFQDSVEGLTPSWLSDSDRVIFNDISIDPPLAQEVELIQSNDSSAQTKLLDGQNLEVETKHLYPIDKGAKDNYQTQQVVDLTDENGSLYDISDTDSDIFCLNEEEPSQPNIKMDPTNGGTSPLQPTVSTQDTNLMGEYDSPSSNISEPNGGRPDSPPITRFRSHQGDMVLRSGRTLRLK